MGAMVPLPDTDSYVLMQYWSNIFLHVSLKRLQLQHCRRCSVRPRARDCLRHQIPLYGHTLAGVQVLGRVRSWHMTRCGPGGVLEWKANVIVVIV